MKRGFLPRNLPLKLVALAGHRPKTVLFGYLIVFALAVFSLGKIRIDSDFLALVPEENPVVQDFRLTAQRFGSIDSLLVALELDENGASDSALDYADIYAELLRDSERINWVEYKLQDFQEAAENLLDRISLFMTPEELDTFEGRLTPEGADAAAERLAEKLASPLDAAIKDLLVKDPLDVAGIVLKRFGSSDLTDRFNSKGYLIDKQETLLLMMVKPTGAAADLPFSRALMAELEAMRIEANETFAEEYPETRPPGMIFAGGYPIAAAEGKLITHDMSTGMLFSLVAVVVLFSFAFGRKTAVLISALPLLCGLAVTFAFLALTVGQLNSATSAFAALLIGLGVDFIIVLYSRYLEERGRGASHEQALMVFGRHTATGVLLGAVTTAATFYAFLISDFRGLSELGLLTGTGILLLVVTVFLMLPALLTLLERNRPGAVNLPRAFGMERFCRLSIEHPRRVVLLAFLVTAVLGWRMADVTYDDDVRNMRSPRNPGLVAADRIMNAFGIRFTPYMVRVDGASEREVLERARNLLADLAPLADGANLARIDSPIRYLPSYEDQEAIVAKLAEDEVDTEAFKVAFGEALSKRGLNPKPFLAGAQPMLDALEVTRPLNSADLEETGLDHLMARYLAHDGDEWSTMVYCYPPAGKWRKMPPPALADKIDAMPHAVLTGPVIISIELKKVVWHDAKLAMIVGTLVVLLFLIWDLGSIGAGLFALFPLGLGLVWTLGAMGWLNLPINFTNIFVFTMIIGIGVDYGIHFIHRWQESRGHETPGVAKAIVIAAMTTVLGFGSLVLSHYPGLRTLGAVAIIGTVATALISITVLPACLFFKTGMDPNDLPEPPHPLINGEGGILSMSSE